MKSSSLKFLLFSLFFTTFAFGVSAQDDDGIYGDIYQAPKVNDDELLDTTVSPLDGYSTVDDYYPEGGYTADPNSNQSNSNQPASEQYVDQNGNNVTNNYYGDYYAADDNYTYASRINRFHRPMYNSGYYDPYYTNTYYYNYDPYYWGTSIYVGYWPSYRWMYSGWGWNYGWGWNSPYYYSPACYGGYGYGGGGSYWNGYNNGYWNGYYDGQAYGGYYNTYDSNSGIYYGHRGSTGTVGNTIGTGYRNTSFASVFNDAAKEGKVSHANKGNVLRTADARPVKVNVDANNLRSGVTRTDVLRGTATDGTKAVSSDRVRTDGGKEQIRGQETATQKSPYQRGTSERATNVQREVSPTIDRSRYRATTTQPRINSGSTDRSATYQRGNEVTRYPSRPSATQPSRSANDQNGNIYRDLQRTQPNTNNGYDRGNPSDHFRQPSRSGNVPQNGNQNFRPSNDQRNQYQQPSRNATPSRDQPSRNATPSRNQEQPSRNVGPSPGSDRGPSGGSFSSPSRSSGSSSPSRGSGSPSRGGRP